MHLIRAALVKDVHDKVTEQHAVSDLNKRLSRQLKARICIFFQAGEVQRDDRNIPHAVFDECLAQQMNVIGRTAAAARLRNHKRNLVQVILAGFQRINKLTDDEQSRITGIVMYIFQTALCNLRPFGFQNLHVVAVVLHDGSNQLELHRQHVRNQNGIVFFHVLGKRNMRDFTRFLHSAFPPLLRRACCECESSQRPDC